MQHRNTLVCTLVSNTSCCVLLLMPVFGSWACTSCDAPSPSVSAKNTASEAELRVAMRDMASLDDEVRLAACARMMQVTPPESARSMIPEMMKLLEHPDRNVKIAVMHALGLMGKNGAAAAIAIEPYTRDSDELLRESAVMTLKLIRDGGEDKTADTGRTGRSATTASCQPTTWRPSRAAIKELAQSLKRGNVARAEDVQRWLGQVECPDAYCRAEARARLTYAIFPSDSSELLPAIARALEAGDSDTRLALLFPLDRMGKEARSLLPELRLCLNDKNKLVRAASAALIDEIEGKAQHRASGPVPPTSQEGPND